ncbi:MAG: hypothetical protein KGH69_03345 [Candidatus Micrarchaeota archaeon]|nr:hypothetical protein [Candidatus Micrarchaeota archaeon]
MAPKMQSAMEYLMTYGWAILAIAIVMVSLYSLGIFNAGSLQPTATPGSCQVVKTAAQTSLAGQCGNLIPKYVAQFSSSSSNVLTSGTMNLPSPISVSVFLWVKPSTGYGPGGGGVNGQSMLSIGTTGSGNMYDINSGSLGVDIWGGCTGMTASTSALTSSKWYFVGYVYTAGTPSMSYYINGAAAGTATLSCTLHEGSNLPVIIGSPPSSSSDSSYSGAIADVQIYNTSLDNTTIKALYQEGIGGAPIDLKHLVGWWPLNGNANDYSGNNNQGTTTSVIWNANWQSGYTSPTS